MTGLERSTLMFRLIEAERLSAKAGIRERHPDYDEGMVHRGYCRLVLGDDLVRAMWPGSELVDP
jgi:hypothetical protein